MDGGVVSVTKAGFCTKQGNRSPAISLQSEGARYSQCISIKFGSSGVALGGTRSREAAPSSSIRSRLDQDREQARTHLLTSCWPLASSILDGSIAPCELLVS